MKTFTTLTLALLLTLTQLSAQTNKLQGKTFLDKNKNGKKELTETGFSNIKVKVAKDLNKNGLIDGVESYVDSTYSDALGNFSFIEPLSSFTQNTLTLSEKDELGVEDSKGNIKDGEKSIKYGSEVIGLYFPIPLNKNTIITSAYLQLTAKKGSLGTISTMKIENNANPSNIDKNQTDDISGRTYFPTSVTYSTGILTKDQTYNTPDLGSIIQTNINDSNWSNGNGLFIMLETGLGESEFYGYDKNGSDGPKLILTSLLEDSTYYVIELDLNTIPSNLILNSNSYSSVAIQNQATDTSTEFAFTSTSLPISMSNMEINEENGDVELSWSTKSELNNNYFSVERSMNGFDFEEIAVINGAGTTNESKEYTYNDNNLESGVYYYRIKQVDFNGAFEYFQILTVQVEKKINVSIYPNPTVNYIQVSTPSENIKSISVFNTSGAQVNFTPGNGNNLNIDMSNLPAGLYHVNIEMANSTSSYQVIKN